MKTQEIDSSKWGEFCANFNEANRGSLLTIELIAADGIRSDVARDAPLDKITFDRADVCNDLFSISLGLPGERKTNHIAIDPIYLRIRQGEAGQKFLEIGAENGTTLVTFHSGRFPQIENTAVHARGRTAQID